ncbi:hypothetical protein M3Y99_01302600 [Aphelenchoides fujianensis]|nr:hypothetical protein M3Y99_01302600 [Aphelenchoides fujianensis]
MVPRKKQVAMKVAQPERRYKQTAPKTTGGPMSRSAVRKVVVCPNSLKVEPKNNNEMKKDDNVQELKEAKNEELVVDEKMIDETNEASTSPPKVPPAAHPTFENDEHFEFTCDLPEFEPTDVHIIHLDRLVIVEARRNVPTIVFNHEKSERFECRLPMAVERRVLKANWSDGRLVIVAQKDELPADAQDKREIPIAVEA